MTDTNGAGLPSLFDADYKPDWLYSDTNSSVFGSSFLNRYPQATASLINGDFRRNDEIDVVNANALLEKNDSSGSDKLTSYGLGDSQEIVIEALPEDGAIPAYFRGANGGLYSSEHYGYPGRRASLSALSPIENVYTPYNGWWLDKYSTFTAMIDQPGVWQQKVGGVAGAILTSIPALADGVIKGFYDAPNNASLAGQKWAQASFLSGHDAAIGYLEGTQYFMTGFLGVGDVATLGSSSAIRPGVPAPMVAAYGGRAVVANAGRGFGKIRLDASLSEADRIFARASGSEIASNEVARLSYARLQQHGTDVRYINDPGYGKSGLWERFDNAVTINLHENLTPREMASTLIHESSHQQRFFRNGITDPTRYEEYLSFRREALFEYGKRPSFEQRRAIWDAIYKTPAYEMLPAGNVPPLIRTWEGAR